MAIIEFILCIVQFILRLYSLLFNRKLLLVTISSKQVFNIENKYIKYIHEDSNLYFTEINFINIGNENISKNQINGIEVVFNNENTISVDKVIIKEDEFINPKFNLKHNKNIYISFDNLNIKNNIKLHVFHEQPYYPKIRAEIKGYKVPTPIDDLLEKIIKSYLLIYISLLVCITLILSLFLNFSNIILNFHNIIHIRKCISIFMLIVFIYAGLIFNFISMMVKNVKAIKINKSKRKTYLTD